MSSHPLRACALLALLCAFVCGAADAGAVPPLRFERLGVDDGLSQQTVLAIAQDPTGFMWFGTEDGLDRYDGYSFQHLRHADVNAPGLTVDFITSLQFDPAGRLRWTCLGRSALARACPTLS